MKVLTIEFYANNPVIEHVPGILLVKDLQHRFIASNASFEEFSGFSPRQLVGLSDFDMPWSKHADIYISHEKDVLAGHDYSVIEPLPGLKRVNLATKKCIIYDRHGVPSGIIATSVPFEPTVELYSPTLKGDIIRIADCGLGLTKTESIVLYLMLKGLKRSDVASRAQISASSYDFHVRNLKIKLKVSSTSEIIAAAYAQGLNDIIPFVISRSFINPTM